VLTVLAPAVARAANGTWTQLTSGGNWSDTANWSGGIVADASGSSAAFNTLDLTADNTVRLDGSRTLTGLTFGDTDTATAFSWILDDNASSGANTLTLAGTTPTITVSAMGTGSSATISAVIAGSTAWTKAGAGKLILSGANTTSGATTITGGTLALSGGTNRLLNTGAFNFSGNNTVLDLGGTSQTLSGMTFANTANQTYTVQGGGTLTLNGASNFILGAPTGSAGTVGKVVNLAGVSNFVYSASNNKFGVGTQNSGNLTGSSNESDTLTLATTSNTITATTFAVVDLDTGTALTNTATVHLGQSNTINATTFNVGSVGRATATLDFATGLASNPALTIRGTAGGSSRADIVIASTAGNRANPSPTAKIDLTTGVTGTSALDAMVGTLMIGRSTRTSTSSQDATGSFIMGGGTLDATTIVLGQDTAGGSSGTQTGTLSLNGGTVKVATLTIGNKNGGNAVIGNFNLNSGTLRATTVQKGAGAATRNFNWSAGSIQNYDASTDISIGTGLTVSLVGSSDDHTFNIDANRTANVAAVVANGASSVGKLVKSGDGALALTAVNTYTGTTSASGGALLVNSPGSTHASSAVTVLNGGTLGGTGTINGTVTVNAGGIVQPTLSGAAGTLTLANATAPAFAASGKLKVRVPTTSTADKVSLSNATPVFACGNVDLVIDTTGLGGASVSGAVIVQTANASGISGTFQSVTANGGYTATVNYNANSITVDLVVTPAQTSTFALSDFSGTQTAGTADTMTVTAKNFYGATATGYVGTIHFTSTDGAATLPADYTFQPSDNGVHTFTSGITLNTPGTQSITVADSVTSSISGTQSGIIVAAGASAATLTVEGFPTPQVAGTPGSVTITAKTAGGSTATSYTGTVTFSSTDGAAVLPTNYTFQPSDNGVHTFTNAVTLKTAGTHSITATDTVASYISGAETDISVVPAAAATLTVTGAPSLLWAGEAVSETVTVKDAYNNLATNYTGTIHFTSTDGAAVLPADYTFTGGDSGTHTFTNGVTFNTDGTQSITATDTGSSVAGTQSGIVIATAETFTWNFPLAGTWSSASKWTNEAGVALPPATSGLAKYKMNFNQSGTYTATQDLADGFVLNQLNFTGSTVTINGNGLALVSNGATPPEINQSAAVNSTVGNNIALNADTTVNLIGNVTLNGVVSGAGGITKTGSGALNLGSSANSFGGPVVVSNGRLTSNAGGNGGFGSGSSITLANGTFLDLNGPSTVVTKTGIFNGGTITANNGFSATWSGPITLNANTTFDTGMSVNGIISGTGGLIKIGGGTMSLNVANTFSGTMAVNVGTLKLGASGSINDATNLTLAASTTFDVSAISSYVLSPSTTLTASGAATAATIKGAVSGTVSLGAQPIQLAFTPTTFSGDVARPALKVSQSALILDNNTFTVTNAAATPLGAGIYRLIQVGDGSTGSITENATPSYPVTVGGAGLALGTSATVSVNSGNVILTVTVGGFASWAAANAPGQSPGDDHDNDGVKNGVEYFMGQSGSSFTSNPGLDETHKIIWPKDTAFNGTWEVETSPDLINWTNVAATDLGTSVEYTLPGGMGTLFVRLVVTPN
jgi:autotransporter-associated beta strand protein